MQQTSTLNATGSFRLPAATNFILSSSPGMNGKHVLHMHLLDQGFVIGSRVLSSKIPMIQLQQLVFRMPGDLSVRIVQIHGPHKVQTYCQEKDEVRVSVDDEKRTECSQQR